MGFVRRSKTRGPTKPVDFLGRGGNSKCCFLPLDCPHHKVLVRLSCGKAIASVRGMSESLRFCGGARDMELATTRRREARDSVLRASPCVSSTPLRCKPCTALCATPIRLCRPRASCHKVFARALAHAISSPTPSKLCADIQLSNNPSRREGAFCMRVLAKPREPASQSHPPHFVCGGEAPFGRLGASPAQRPNLLLIHG